MNPYPPAAEAVDTHLSKSIENLQRATEQGIGRIETRMGEMATKEAVAAHVARLDQRDDHLESRMMTGLDSVKSEMTAGFASVAARDAERDAATEKREIARDQAAKERDEERDKKFTRRMTWTLTTVGILVSVIQFVLAPLIGT